MTFALYSKGSVENKNNHANVTLIKVGACVWENWLTEFFWLIFVENVWQDWAQYSQSKSNDILPLWKQDITVSPLKLFHGYYIN